MWLSKSEGKILPLLLDILVAEGRDSTTRHQINICETKELRVSFELKHRFLVLFLSIYTLKGEWIAERRYFPSFALNYT